MQRMFLAPFTILSQFQFIAHVARVLGSVIVSASTFATY